MVIGTGGALRVWEPHKTAQEAGAREQAGAPLTCAAGARVAGTWWLVWGDARGRVLRANISSHVRAPASRTTRAVSPAPLAYNLTENQEVIVSTRFN